MLTKTSKQELNAMHQNRACGGLRTIYSLRVGTDFLRLTFFKVYLIFELTRSEVLK